MIIAIDGPAGSGKGTIASLVSKKLNLVNIDTGATYRCVALEMLKEGVSLEETDKIMKAQMARGADFESGSIIKRAKNLVPLLVPLFISAFRRANDLAMAMEARCYRGGEGRTKMKPLIYRKRDAAAYGILSGYMILMVVFGKILF